MRSPSRRGFSKPPSVSSSAELDGLGFSRAGDRTDQADRHVGIWDTSANRCRETNDGPPTYYQPIPTGIANGRYGGVDCHHRQRPVCRPFILVSSSDGAGSLTLATASACRLARLSRLTLARISDASTWAISPAAIFQQYMPVPCARTAVGTARTPALANCGSTTSGPAMAPAAHSQ